MQSRTPAYTRVIEAEAEALSQLATHQPADFEDAVAAILAIAGRVVVCGIGKSGHIGRKLAATLASTGTPALFLHPSEASHGDLGQIATDDIVILISNSGETQELSDVLVYVKRFGVPLIAVTSRTDSTLARSADHLLNLPKAPEACPMGLAPTTSTTMTLALGDALAVALMEARGFGAENFAVFHPGGKLGAQLQLVGALMHQGAELPVVKLTTPMSETLIEMTSKGLGIAAVVDEETHLVGVVTDGDLRRNMARLLECAAGDVATRDPITIQSDRLAAEALAILNERKTTALVVCDDKNRPVGVVHIHDLLRAGVA